MNPFGILKRWELDLLIWVDVIDEACIGCPMAGSI